MQFLKSQ